MKHRLSPEWNNMFDLKEYVDNLQKIAERIVLENGYTNDNYNRTDSAVGTGSDADSRLGS